MTKQYQTRPQLVDAIQLTADNAKEVAEFIGGSLIDFDGANIVAHFHNASPHLQLGEYVVRDHFGLARMHEEGFLAKYVEVVELPGQESANLAPPADAAETQELTPAAPSAAAQEPAVEPEPVAPAAPEEPSPEPEATTVAEEPSESTVPVAEQAPSDPAPAQ
jgi:hypothetical protein